MNDKDDDFDGAWEHLAPKTQRKYRQAREFGFNTFSECETDRVQQDGLENRTDYQNALAEIRGYANGYELKAHQAKERTCRAENKAFSLLIHGRLDYLGKLQVDIARELGVSKVSMHFYTHGKSIPRGERLQQLLGVLETPYSTLEEVVDDYPDFKRCDWSGNEPS